MIALPGDGVVDMNTGKYGFTGTVAKMGQPKENERYGWWFFVLVALDDKREILCMFDVSHQRKFKVGDRISFDASVGRPSRKDGTVWHGVEDTHGVQVLGQGYVPIEEVTLEVDYVGWPRTIDDSNEGESNAQVNGEWCLKFPVSVMRAYFGGTREYGGVGPQPDAGPGLFGVLGIPATDDEKVIKSGYRRMARAWHPDVSDHPQAQQRFMEVDDAYKLLMDPAKRAKYRASLLMAGSQASGVYQVTQASVRKSKYGYAPPCKLGRVKMKAKRIGSAYQAVEILSWEVPSRSERHVFPMSMLTFKADGVIIPLMPFPEEVSSEDLPFKTSEKLNQRPLVGSVTVHVVEELSARWRQSPFSSDRGGRAEQFWRPVRVEKIEFDQQAILSVSSTVVSR